MSKLSIIMPVLNEGERIAGALASLFDLRALGTEVIVVDGGSSDATVEPAKLQADLFAIKNSAQATPARQQMIAADLTSMAQGAVKPSSVSLNKLAADLTAACGEKALPLASCSRLAQNLNAVLSGSHFPANQMQAIVDDVQAIFQANGLARKQAVAIADNVKAISTEIHK